MKLLSYIFLFVLLAGSLFSCHYPIDDMEDKFLRNTKELEELTIGIQSQNKVKYLLINKINVNKINGSIDVIGINGWFHRNKHWEKWDRHKGVEMFKESFEGVLSYENINEGDYEVLIKAMQNLNIEKLASGEEYFCSGCIEFGTGLVGLRYYHSDNSTFEIDYEYIDVKKLSKNWYAYQRDWN